MHSDFKIKGDEEIVDNLGDPNENNKYLNRSLSLNLQQEKAEEIAKYNINIENFHWKDVRKIFFFFIIKSIVIE